MINRLTQTTAAIVIILIAFVAVIFIFQTLIKLIFYLIARFTKTKTSGFEIFDFLLSKEDLDSLKVKNVSYSFRSSLNVFSRHKQTFTISKKRLSKDNLTTNLYGLKAIASTNIKNGFFSIYTQFWLIAIVSMVEYLLIGLIMLMTFLPNVDVNQRIELGYKIGVEALSIVGFVLFLVIIFWWIKVSQDFNENLLQLLEKTNDSDLIYKTKNFLNITSYLPFSVRTVI